MSKYQYKRQVMHSDIDAAQVVHFSKYAVFIEDGLNHAFKTILGEQFDLSWMNQLRIIRYQIHYQHPARFNDELTIEIDFFQLGISSGKIGFVISKQDITAHQRLADGFIFIAYVHSVTGKPEAFPHTFMKLIKG